MVLGGVVVLLSQPELLRWVLSEPKAIYQSIILYICESINQYYIPTDSWAVCVFFIYPLQTQELAAVLLVST